MHEHWLFLAKLDFSILPEELLDGILLGAIYALIALGYTMVYGVLKLINFAHGDVYMLGAYIALFISYFLGFMPEASPPLVLPAVLHTVVLCSLIGLVGGAILSLLALVLKGRRWSDIGFALGLAGVFLGGATWLTCRFQPQAMDMLLMLYGSMFGCALIGIIIERLAYRPMRSHSRIATLITAIGVSLFIEYGGSLFLPNSPPPSVAEHVNPYTAPHTWVITSGNQKLYAEASQAKAPYEGAKQAFDQYIAERHMDPFNTDAQGTALKSAMQSARDKYQDLANAADNSKVQIHYQTGQLLILLATFVLMVVMTYLVMFTKAGRAMRAVSHDFDSAALMGVNVSSVIVFTFVLGSSLAGAGAMMQATVQGTPLTSFSGLLPGVKAFSAAVLGGIGNIPGAVVGGLLIGIAETVATWAGASDYKDAIAFVILILVLLFRPSGILGSSQVEKV